MPADSGQVYSETHSRLNTTAEQTGQIQQAILCVATCVVGSAEKFCTENQTIYGSQKIGKSTLVEGVSTEKQQKYITKEKQKTDLHIIIIDV